MGERTPFDTTLIRTRAKPPFYIRRGGNTLFDTTPKKRKTKNTINFLIAFKRFLGGVLRRVFQFEWVKIPPSILPPKDKKEKYSKVRSFAKSAQDDALSPF